MTVRIEESTIGEAVQKVLEREKRAKMGLALMMTGCEPTRPTLEVAGKFYGLTYGIYTLDVVRGVVEITGTTGNRDKAVDPSTIAQTKQIVLQSINDLRKALDDYEQFVRTV